MKVIFKNTKLRLEKYVEAFSSGYVPNIQINQNSPTDYGYATAVESRFGCYWYKNETDAPQTFRVYNCIGNKYGGVPFIAISNDVPSLEIVNGIPSTNVTWVNKLESVDRTITVPPGKYIGIAEYGMADSGDMVPDVDIDGTHVPLPSKT